MIVNAETKGTHITVKNDLELLKLEISYVNLS